FGKLYGADLIGAATAAVVFLPAIAWLRGPDAVWLSALCCALASLLIAPDRLGRRIAGVSTVVSVVAIGGVLSGSGLLQVRSAVGWADGALLETRWTPLTRLSVLHQGETDLILLDNATLSTVVEHPGHLRPMRFMANRSLIYQLDVPQGPVAILAASAGPDVATAISYGFDEIDAIDIEGEIFELVADRYPGPLNPYHSDKVTQVVSDARSAMMRAPSNHYTIIQLVNANLFGASGMLANAWSPSLLTTKEAFDVYLDRLTDDGVLSMTDLRNTRWLVLSAVAALEDRGVAEPLRHIAYVAGPNEVLLLRPRPWTAAELATLNFAAETYFRSPLILNPMAPVDDVLHTLRFMPSRFDIVPPRPGATPPPRRRQPHGLPPTPEQLAEMKKAEQRAAPEPPSFRTDDHPYLDTPERALQSLRENTFPDGMLYRTLLVQGGLVLLFGGAIIGLPLLGRGRRAVAGELPAIGYVACLGAGYLSVETVLLYNLTLFIGHPTYTIATVVFSMLVFSGLGSMFADQGPDRAVARRLRMTLIATLALGLFQVFVVVGWMTDVLITSSLWVRILAAAVSLAPLSFVMGTCFPYGMRLVTSRAPRLVAWAWAVNGWMSVLGGLVTVIIARTLGYSAAMIVALSAYAVALTLVGRMQRGTQAEALAPSSADGVNTGARHQAAN
ncbi:MAG: hypothetical protein AAFV53_36520, partial [Myxococcota bacterium]